MPLVKFVSGFYKFECAVYILFSQSEGIYLANQRAEFSGEYDYYELCFHAMITYG